MAAASPITRPLWWRWVCGRRWAWCSPCAASRGKRGGTGDELRLGGDAPIDRDDLPIVDFVSVSRTKSTIDLDPTPSQPGVREPLLLPHVEHPHRPVGPARSLRPHPQATPVVGAGQQDVAV